MASSSASSPRSLPDRPSLEYLRKLAKDRLVDLRRGGRSARLADAQLAVAREHGFSSWRKLRAHLDQLVKDAASPGSPPDAGAPGPSAAPDALVADFFAALNKRDEAAVRAMLAGAPALANARDADGATALSIAAEVNDPALVDALLRAGADPSLPYAHSAHTPLSWAVTVGSLDAARALVRGGVAADLFCAAGMGDADAVRSFFEPDGRLRPGASRTGSSRYAADGTQLPCPPESPREVVADALYVACRAGHAAAVEVLLAHDPDLSFQAFFGGTPFHWAHFAGSRPVIELLARAGADPDARDPALGCTPRAFGICVPANWGWMAKVRNRLAEDPALADIMEGRGAPLHEAAREGHLAIAKLLVEAGADPLRRDPEGRTPLDLALARPDRPGCVSVAEWLSALVDPRPV